DVGAVKAGQAAWVTLTSLPLARFEGAVALVEPDPEARNARLRVSVLDPGRALRPGEAAQVHVDLELVDRLAVPAKAVLYSGDRRITFVDRGEGRLEPRGLKVGTQADGFIEVLEGLGAGDRVLIAGTFLAAAESRVRSAALWHDEPVSKATLASERAKAQKERAERERAERERAKAERAAGAGAKDERAAGAGAKDERAAGAGAKAGGGGPKGHEDHEGDEGDEGDKGDKGAKGEGAKGGEP
ncbi:MAG TPA: hypothetical protein VFS00_18885, partial [Polyangiaceae bacterium]|nr:hypothetical protein [Polyangiaceae bacterium]